MLSQLDPKRDLRICGQVIYTGKSSMEVVVKMESIGSGLADETVMIGKRSTHRGMRVMLTILKAVSQWYAGTH